MGIFDVFSGKNDRKAAMIAATQAQQIQAQIQAALEKGQALGVGAVDEATPQALGAIDTYEPIAQGQLAQGRDLAVGSIADYGQRSIGALNDGESRATGYIDKAEPLQLARLEKGYGLARDSVNTGTDRALSYYKPFVEGGLKSYGSLQNHLGNNGPAGYDSAIASYRESPATQVAVKRATEQATRQGSALGQLGSGNTMAEIADRTQETAQLGYDRYVDRLERDSDRGYAASGASAGLEERRGNTIGGYYAQEGRDTAGVIGEAGQARAGIAERSGLARSNVYDGIGSRTASIQDGWGRSAAALTADAGARRSSIYEGAGRTKANIYTGTASQIGSSIGDLGKTLVDGTYRAFDGADKANANSLNAAMGMADLGVKFATGMWGVPSLSTKSKTVG